MSDTTRHYCYKCKVKKQEKFMQPVEMSINNRMKWECKDNCKQPEHRNYGRTWKDYTRRYNRY